MTLTAPGLPARKRVLFVAEAVSLAHATRPLVLAKALDAAGYEVHFAVAARYPLAFEGTSIRVWPIDSTMPGDFQAALARGQPIYDADTLTGYVRQELALLEQLRPDVVVGDFRLSLSVSAALRRVHYVSITNGHWSPYSSDRSLPLPEHPLGRILGVTLAEKLFRLVTPFVLAHHARPLNRVRRAHGLPPLDGLRQVYTSADTTLYADVPQLVPTRGLPCNHRYIGPIVWSPDLPSPPWWNALPGDRVCVYVTLGSSGQVGAIEAVLEALAALPVAVMLATANRLETRQLPDNVLVAAYLPGAKAAKRAALVICNGGSATVYQALAEGRPVLGIPSNLDQHLTMARVTAVGAGLSVRAEHASAQRIRDAVTRLLADEQWMAGAQRVAGWFGEYPAERMFVDTMDEIASGGSDAMHAR